MLLSVFLFGGGCARSQKPKVSVLPKCRGTMIMHETAFGVEMDFTVKPELLIIKAGENAFDTRYTFHKDTVTLRYDDIETTLDLSALPDTNTAGLVYKLMHLLISEKVRWEKNGSLYRFSGKLNGTVFNGECDKKGHIVSFEIPLYQLYFKNKNE